MPYDADGLGSLSLTLGIIVLLLWGGIWAMRRMRPGLGLGAARDCTILRSLALGPRERLVVVQVGARQLVIGIGSAPACGATFDRVGGGAADRRAGLRGGACREHRCARHASGRAWRAKLHR